MPQKLCDHCHLPLTDPRSNQKRHKECAKIAHLIQCKERTKKKWLKLSPIINKICPVCQQEYQTRENRDAATCKKTDCKNKWQAKKRREAWASLSDEQRKEKNRIQYQKYAKFYKEKGIGSNCAPECETRDCKCPGCGVIHAHTFEPAWIGNPNIKYPPIKCSRYPHCVNGPAFKDGARSGEQRYASTYGSSWECSNSAMI